MRLPAAGSPGGENGDSRPNFTVSLAAADDGPIPQSKTTTAIRETKPHDNFLQCKIFIGNTLLSFVWCFKGLTTDFLNSET
jgi:hypothetical protein